MEKRPGSASSHLGDCWAFLSRPRTPSTLWFDGALLVPEKHHPQFFCEELESSCAAGGGDLAPLDAAASHRMCLEDTPIDRPYAVDAMAREWSIHGMADQSVRLCVGDTLASPSTVFHMVDDPNHAQAEAGSPFERLADNAFSGSISHNLRMSEEICQVGTISRSP